MVQKPHNRVGEKPGGFCKYKSDEKRDDDDDDFAGQIDQSYGNGQKKDIFYDRDDRGLVFLITLYVVHSILRFLCISISQYFYYT